MAARLSDAARVARELAAQLDAEKHGVDAMLAAGIGPRPGDRVLETMCGTGGAGLAIAPLVAPGGIVICSDRSLEMLAAARAVAADRGVHNVDFRRLDAERLDLPDRCVEGVICRLGWMVLREPARAAAEAWRVLRPGRRLALTVWSERERNPWRSVPEDVLSISSAPFEPGPFALADGARLTGMLVAAGFDDVRVDRVRADHSYANADEYWAMCLRKSHTVRTAFAELDMRHRIEAKADIVARVRARTSGAAGFVVPAEMLVAVGTARASTEESGSAIASSPDRR